ncbi:MAG: 2-oxo acid dehydrogenase subunit [Conexibacter sp.]|nr:2-oxo acid dehydrogenase subunit [Conexibacter sp.]
MAATTEPNAEQPAASGAKGDVETVELTRAQRTVARRTAESKATIPDFQVSTEADVTELLALGGTLEDDATLDDFVVRATALALREHPRVNGAYSDGSFLLHSRVNVGVAVAAPDTLAMPTVFDADVKPVAAIAAEVRALAAKVREGTIAPRDLGGATFTVSNLGMLGVTAFTAVVTPGQAAALAVGAAVQRVALDARGGPIVRHVLTLTLSCDHRILYGADAAAFLARVRELLESPSGLIA